MPRRHENENIFTYLLRNWIAIELKLDLTHFCIHFKWRPMHCFAFNCLLLLLLLLLLPAHKTFSGYLLLWRPSTHARPLGGVAAPRPPSFSYYRNRICQIEVEMLSACPCPCSARAPLGTWHPFIVWLFVCLFACWLTPHRPPASHFINSFIVSGWASVSVSAFGCPGRSQFTWLFAYLAGLRLSIAVFIAILASTSSFIEYQKKFIACFRASARLRNCWASILQLERTLEFIGDLAAINSDRVPGAVPKQFAWILFNCLSCGYCLLCGDWIALVRCARIMIDLSAIMWPR